MAQYIHYDSEIQLAIWKTCQHGLSDWAVTQYFSGYHKGTWKEHRKGIQAYPVSLAVLALQGWVSLNFDWLKGKEVRAMYNGRTCETYNGRMRVLNMMIDEVIPTDENHLGDMCGYEETVIE